MMRQTLIPILLALAAPAATAAPPQWVGTWASAQQIPEPANALPPASLTDATLREIVHVSIGGPEIRIRLSNAFGTAPLTIDDVHVAPGTAGSARIAPGRNHPVTFNGAHSVTIPAGADYWSDAVAMPVGPFADLAVSMHFAAPPAQETGHPGSRSTSYVLPGDHAGDPDLPGATAVEHWYNLSGIAVAGDGAAVVAFGDSITDGHATTTNGNDRWPDDLARRLAAAGRRDGVLNVGIGGNRMLLDGLGPNALARFDRDVLAQPGVNTVILLEGINDLGTLTRDHPVSAAEHAALVAAIIGSYRQFIERAHEHGLRVIGATIMPDGGSGYYHPDAANEADLAAINAWVRAPRHFDAVVDLDRVMRDPAHPNKLLPAYDSGDGLHPGPAGYRAMAAAIPLSLLR